MTNTDTDLLRNLRARVLDETESLVGLLRTCLALGIETGSESLRLWAGQELKGYPEGHELPSYRFRTLPILMDSTSGPTWSKAQLISPAHIPASIREQYLPDGVEFRQPIDELVQMATGDEALSLTSGGLSLLTAMWNRELPYAQNIQRIYWQTTPAVIAGMVGMVRTVLVEMVVDMAHDVPFDGLPSKSQVDSAVQLHIYRGDHNEVSVGTNSGVVGAGAKSRQTQNNGIVSPELTQLIGKMRESLSDVEDADSRSDVEQAIDDFEEAVTAENPEPEKVKRRAGALRRLASSVGGVVLTTATAEGTQLAVEALGGVLG